MLYMMTWTSVSMPSRAVTSFLHFEDTRSYERVLSVNALSGCYLISTAIRCLVRPDEFECQCPLGLLPHFYPEKVIRDITKYMVCVNALSGCYLIST